MVFNLLQDDDLKWFIRENVLDQYQKNQPITKTIIPTYEIMFKEESGFGVYLVEDVEENEFSIKGNFVSPLIIGQTYLLEGYISEYRGEKQVTVNRIQNIKPVNKRGIIAYLQTLKGLKKKAEHIYEAFGDKSIEILMNNPLEVAKKVKGIGKKSALNWSEQLKALKDTQVFIATLLGYGLNANQANKLFKAYGEEVVQLIEKNPYFLAKEVQGYGFERCDRIARMIGHHPKSTFRIQEGIMYVLEQSMSEGHCYLPYSELIERTKNLLTIRLTLEEMKQYLIEQKGVSSILYRIGDHEFFIDYKELQIAYDNYISEKNRAKRELLRYPVVPFIDNDVTDQLDELVDQKRILIENDKIYLRWLYEDEKKVAERIAELVKTTPFPNPINIESELEEYLQSKGLELEKKQYEAVIEFSKEMGGFFILNGSAGCGKTFTLKIILEMLERQYRNNQRKCDILVLAPTGKASKVASKSTGRECMTIHRGLGYNPMDGFTFNETNQLDVDVVVVDESSMIDISLAKHLLVAIANGTKVIFLGDTKQLPSVGAGNVLKDLIASGAVPIITLDIVKRQNALSGIIRNANKIIHGEMIESCIDTNDAFVVLRNSPKSIFSGIIQSFKRILSFPEFTIEDVQVLAPQRNGSVGTYLLNYVIQQEFNPRSDKEMKVLNKKFDVKLNDNEHPETFHLYFQKGDKVIHTNNDYGMEWHVKIGTNYLKDESTIGITNGECGVIEDIINVIHNKEKITRIIVRYEDKYVFYDNDFNNLDHAWALTIHKSQGSQWKAVVMPISNSHYLMLDNNLFYTGYTRAESFHCVIGQKYAIKHAIKTFRTTTRYTALDERLKRICSKT